MSIKDSWVMPVLAVDDVERAKAFYRDTLGCTVRSFPDDTGSAVVEIGQSYLLLYKTEFRRGETTMASLMVDDVPETVRELRGRGVRFEDYDQPGLKTEDGIATYGDMQTAWFRDSEGNILAVSSESAEFMRRAA
jgi:catechol 2,3-dioxygenase-like lactoylglutathione lyase family enzyme